MPLMDIENGSGDVGGRLLDDCNSRFFDYNWAEFGKTKTAVKLHTLIGMGGKFQRMWRLHPAKVHDIGMLDQMPVSEDAVYAMDRGYVDFGKDERSSSCFSQTIEQYPWNQLNLFRN
jgi:hypothetical protein